MSFSLVDASQVLERNLSVFQDLKCLLVNNPGDQLASALQSVGATSYSFSYHFGFHQQHSQQLPANQCHYGTEVPEQWGQFDAVILYWPKEKPLATLLLEQLLQCCHDSSVIYCVGGNKEGIKSAASVAKKIGMRSNKLDAARHCSLYALPVASLQHKPTSKPLTSYEKRFTIEWRDQTIELVTLPGVFSAEHLDAGTELLIADLPDDLGTKTVDFGCGCGVVSAILASQNRQRQVYSVDVNAFALLATQRTLAANQLTATVYPVTGVEDISQQQLSAIVTNPPFHQGVKTHYHVTENLIAKAPRLLSATGQLVLVANRFLQYPDLLEKAFKTTSRRSETSKFVVYQSRSC
ncbi:ribosomal RNA small subunit methyltransferase C [Neiella marina]|uniref:Ribosomal RNA small subunit methyltransferase C n=1 Tax=Neiella marina TaxID=508461 RepID=A0A8J2U9S0_9GAMM|nr:methyltransferase [Neiella marina]GGA87993.1 ribosomal RNA small subunit methyltransferase C [Neiella marina]